MGMIKDRVLRINDLVIFLGQNNIIKKPDGSIDKTLQKLLELKIIQETDESPSSPVSITNNSNQNKMILY